jgi:hypothetical protein
MLPRAAPAALCAALILSGCRHGETSRPVAARTGAPAAAAPGEIALVPGVAFGPIEIGMTREQIAALGILTTHPYYSAMTVPFDVGYDEAARVNRIALSLAHAQGPVRVGDVVIPLDATPDEAARLLGDCEPPVVDYGGTAWACRKRTITLLIGADPNELWIKTPGD